MNVEESSSKAMLAIDGTGFDWSYMAQEEASTNFALMAFFDSELKKSKSDLDSYKKGLASVEEQLVFYKKNESLFAPPSIDLSNSGLEKFKQPEFKGYDVKVNKCTSENVSKEVKQTSDAPIIEDWVSDCDEDETVVLESLNVQKPKQADQPRKVSQNPRNNSTSWNTPMPKKLGVGFQFTPKACFVCGSFNHLIKDCDFHDKRMVQKPVLNNVKKGTGQREVRPVWTNAMRVNHQKISNSRRNFAPTAVLTKSGLVPFSTARQSFSRTTAPVSAARSFNTVVPSVNVAKPRTNAFQKSHSPLRRPFYQQTALKNRNLNNKVNTAKVERLKKEKEDNQFKIDNFENASKSLDQLIGNQISDNNKKGLGYNVVPPPLTGLFAPPSIDLSNSGLEKFKQPEFEGYGVKVNKGASENVSKEVKKTSDAPIIEDWVSDCDEDETVVLESLNVQKPKQADQPRKVSQNPRNNSTSWNTPMPKKLGVGFQFTPKACFVCGSFNHLIKDCDFHDKRMVQKPVLNNVKKGTGQREVRSVWTNAMRVNHQKFSNSRRNFAPTAVLTKSGLVPFSTARQSFSKTTTPVSAARSFNNAIPSVNVAKPRTNAFQKSHSPLRRPFYQQTTLKNRNLNNKVNTAKVISVTTVKRMTSDVGEQGINARILSNRGGWKKQKMHEWSMTNFKEAKDSEVCKITRADGSSSFHGDIQTLLRRLDRQDLSQLYSLVQERFKDHPLEGHDLDLWGDLRMIFDPNEEDDIWLN
ncbi:hypothetical protein Tco_1121459 [Tanacetum coccineum]|uniref:CCHC-type domain-containing protein n=1 Tax=Tanacetum coccineum TaxID=301880 RepID=A0ABQ5IXZ0_9ASTR